MKEKPTVFAVVLFLLLLSPFSRQLEAISVIERTERRREIIRTEPMTIG
jgi:hypothetical protein